MTSALTADALAELKRLDAEATAGPWRASGNLVWRTFRDSQERRCHTPIAEVVYLISMRDGESEANAALFAAVRNALPALLSELEQSRVERKEMMEALVQARGALLLDHMVDDDGEPFGTTTVAVEAVDAVLSRARQRTGDQT